MSERQEAAEQEAAVESGSRKRASPVKRYAWTLASAVVQPRNLRKDNYDPERVFGPVVFTLITFVGASLLQLALWQRDPLVAAFELPRCNPDRVWLGLRDLGRVVGKRQIKFIVTWGVLMNFTSGLCHDQTRNEKDAAEAGEGDTQVSLHLLPPKPW